MRHEEDEIQIGICEVFDLMGIWYYHVPNQALGKCSIQRAVRFKRMGLKAGIADLVLSSDSGVAHYLEVKTAKGKLSKAERDFRDLCKLKSWPYAIARSVDEAVAQAKAWGLAKFSGAFPVKTTKM